MITRLFDSQNKMCNLFNYVLCRYIYACICMFIYVHHINTGHICEYLCVCVCVHMSMYACVYPSPFSSSSKTEFRGNYAVVVSFEYANNSCPWV